MHKFTKWQHQQRIRLTVLVLQKFHCNIQSLWLLQTYQHWQVSKQVIPGQSCSGRAKAFPANAMTKGWDSEPLPHQLEIQRFFTVLATWNILTSPEQKHLSTLNDSSTTQVWSQQSGPTGFVRSNATLTRVARWWEIISGHLATLALTHFRIPFFADSTRQLQQAPYHCLKGLFTQGVPLCGAGAPLFPLLSIYCLNFCLFNQSINQSIMSLITGWQTATIQ